VLHTVEVGVQRLDAYGACVAPSALDEVRRLARGLAGLRVAHVSATPYGGGVAELLRSMTPLLRDLGLDATWALVSGDDRFFAVTKAIHNALQGSPERIDNEMRETYLAFSARNAELLDDTHYDIVVVHDPQPLALAQHGDGVADHWVWRCHIDTSEPSPGVYEFLRPFISSYDAAVFTLPEFVLPDFPVPLVETIAPAIDPLSPKNIELDDALTRRLLAWIGLDADAPLVTQISRFDPWKDPLGVIEAFRLVRDAVPDVQCALVGSMALDDPEGWRMYRQITEAIRDDPFVHVFTNLTGVGNVEVNAFQRLSEVVIQKSIREGFGLVVSEALWKGTPVVAGHAGGIPLQLEDGKSGYLVTSAEECAARTIELLGDAERRALLGACGREHVREHFLLPRLLADELRLYAKLLGVA
jgi:trehalose synthase